MENLNRYLDHYSKIKPDSPFIKSQNQVITFKETVRQVNSLSYNLNKLGASPGKTIGLLLPNISEFVFSYYSILKTGSIAVLIPITSSPAELATFIKSSQTEILIYNEEFNSVIEEIGSLSKRSFRKIVLESGSKGINLICLTETSESSSQRYMNKVGNEAVVLFTAGTESLPKGVVLSHENILSNALACSEHLSFDVERCFLAVLPFYYSMGHTVVMNTALVSGGTLILLPKFNPEEVVNLIKKEQISIFVGVPAMFKKIAELNTVTEDDLKSLSVCISGGSPLPVSVIDEYKERFNRIFFEGYGLTEASPAVSFNQNIERRKIGSVGLPLSCNQMRLVDESGAEVPTGNVGEVQIRGKNVMLRYLEESSQHNSDEHEWFSTGDLMHQDEDGYYYFVGRKSDQIKKFGYKIHPKSIESVIQKHPKVRDAVAIGIYGNSNGQSIKLCIIPKSNEKLTTEEILNYADEHLPKYLRPDLIEFYEHFPRNNTGKILKRKLVTK